MEEYKDQDIMNGIKEKDEQKEIMEWKQQKKSQHLEFTPI